MATESYEQVVTTPTSEGKGNRRKTSFVWEYFHVCEDDVRKAVCNNCGALIVRGRDTRSFSTSSLASHIKYCHRPDDDPFKRMKRKRPTPPATDLNMFGVAKEGTQAPVPGGATTPKQRRQQNSLEPQAPEIETYVYPEQLKDVPTDVICSKRIDLIHSGLMMHVMYEQHRSGKFCDLMLISAPLVDVTPKIPTPTDGILTTGRKGNKRVFHAHSSILAAVSAKIKALIEMGSRTIELKDVSAFGLKSLLEIVYTGRLKRKSPLRFIEAHHIWKAASNLGIKYVHEYLANDHPQVAKWIADEERQSQAAMSSEKDFIYEITEEQNNDLVDLCASGPPPVENEERHDYVEVLNDEDQVDSNMKPEHFVDFESSHVEENTFEDPPHDEVEQDSVKTEESAKLDDPMVEITFSKS